MKRTFYTLSAAAALFGAAPATTFAADAAEAWNSSESCPCAALDASAAAARPDERTKLTDREQEFLQAVWSAP